MDTQMIPSSSSSHTEQEDINKILETQHWLELTDRLLPNPHFETCTLLMAGLETFTVNTATDRISSTITASGSKVIPKTISSNGLLACMFALL